MDVILADIAKTGGVGWLLFALACMVIAYLFKLLLGLHVQRYTEKVESDKENNMILTNLTNTVKQLMDYVTRNGNGVGGK